MIFVSQPVSGQDNIPKYLKTKKLTSHFSLLYHITSSRFFFKIVQHYTMGLHRLATIISSPKGTRPSGFF